MRKISSSGRKAGMPYLCWAKGSVAPVLASESASSLQGSPELPRTHWKLKSYAEGEGVGERGSRRCPKYPRRILVGKRWVRREEGKCRLRVG